MVILKTIDQKTIRKQAHCQPQVDICGHAYQIFFTEISILFYNLSKHGNIFDCYLLFDFANLHIYSGIYPMKCQAILKYLYPVNQRKLFASFFVWHDVIHVSPWHYHKNVHLTEFTL